MTETKTRLLRRDKQTEYDIQSFQINNTIVRFMWCSKTKRYELLSAARALDPCLLYGLEPLRYKLTAKLRNEIYNSVQQNERDYTNVQT